MNWDGITALAAIYTALLSTGVTIGGFIAWRASRDRLVVTGGLGEQVSAGPGATIRRTPRSVLFLKNHGQTPIRVSLLLFGTRTGFGLLTRDPRTYGLPRVVAPGASEAITPPLLELPKNVRWVGVKDELGRIWKMSRKDVAALRRSLTDASGDPTQLVRALDAR